MGIRSVDTVHAANRAVYLKSLKVFPDPIHSNGTINIQFNSLEEKRNVLMEVFELSGRLVYSTLLSAKKGENVIGVSSVKFSKGEYWVRVSGYNLAPITNRFVVE